MQVEDRVADELAGPVVGRLAAAVGLDDLDVGAFRDVQLARLGAPAERDHRRVLEQEDRVRQRAALNGAGERPLQLPRLAVGDEAEVPDLRGLRHRASGYRLPCGSRAGARSASGRRRGLFYASPLQTAGNSLASWMPTDLMTSSIAPEKMPT